jgi:hypothetical protein
VKVYLDVLNDDGGSLDQSSWSVHVSGASATPGSFGAPAAGQFQLVTVHAGQTFTVTPTSVAGYGYSRAGECGTNPLTAGVVGQCTITEDDQPAYVTVVTTVSGGGSPSDFQIDMSATNARPGSHSGTANGYTYLITPGSYTVSVSSLNGYAVVYSPACSGSVGRGLTKTCTIQLTAPTGPIGGGAPQLGVVGPAWLALPLLRARRRVRGLRPEAR